MTKRVEMSAEELAEMETRAEKWKRRALRFQEAYRESEAENTALKIQKMHLEADGVDKVTRIQRDNMKARAMAEINVRRAVEAQLRDKQHEVEIEKSQKKLLFEQLREKERELAAARSAAFREAAQICEDEGAREACAVAEILRVKAAELERIAEGSKGNESRPGAQIKVKDLAECWPVGEFIREELEARHWTTRDLAIRMGGTSRQMGINQLATELLIAVPECPLGDEFARDLAKVFGVSPELFINLDRTYREWLARAGAVPKGEEKP